MFCHRFVSVDTVCVMTLAVDFFIMARVVCLPEWYVYCTAVVVHGIDNIKHSRHCCLKYRLNYCWNIAFHANNASHIQLYSMQISICFVMAYCHCLLELNR